ncbi:MAG: dTDP-4-dehydrorhamnose 3,5-epimerase family protein [Ignavibacteria bacterium]|nr:dTDP-4-dehydrorhamnose 3,5-epimerase family protein [Ignavibacteria bacterium]
MKVIETLIPDVKILKTSSHQDERGTFAELLNEKEITSVDNSFKIVQVNYAFNKNRGTLRGFHFQSIPFQQTKVVLCLQGAIIDVAVDIRPSSPSFKKFVSFFMLGQNTDLQVVEKHPKISYDYIVEFPNKVYIPKGFAHAYLTLVPNSEIVYFLDVGYQPDFDRSIRFDDPDINFPWPEIQDKFIISKKDESALFLKDLDIREL